MPRAPRINKGGFIYHVLNRANGRLPLFKTETDYRAMLHVLTEAHERVTMRTIGYCIMPNHWHLLLWPKADGDLSAFTRWVTVTHTQRWHAAHDTAGSGHIYQGRFKSFPIQQTSPPAGRKAMGFLEGGNAVLSVLRYIERNPLRAGLVTRSQEWPWSSAHARMYPDSINGFRLTAPPVTLPDDWIECINRPMTNRECEALQRCIQRGSPFGREPWVKRIAEEWGLESTIRRRGRPKKRRESNGTHLPLFDEKGT